MLCPGCGYGRLGDVRNAANGASTAVFWLARLAWVLVGVVAPWSALADGRSTAVSLLLGVSGWTAWTVVLVAVVIPSAVSLTVVRVISPLALVAAVAAGNVPVVIVAAAALVLFSVPDTTDCLVQGGAYGAETRFLLRTPVPYLLPAVLVWALFVGSMVAGPLLVAARAWVPGAAVTAIGIVLAVRVPRRLHRLSRRWLVIVPAGIVVHDHMVLAETLMVRRSQTRDLSVAAENGEAADLTGGVMGSRVIIALSTAEKVILTPITMRTLGTGEALHVQMFSVAPRRVRAAHALLVNERA